MARKDYLGNIIMVGDTLYVALLQGRSARLQTRIVKEILDDGRIRVTNPDTTPRYSARRDGLLEYAKKTIVDLTKRTPS